MLSPALLRFLTQLIGTLQHSDTYSFFLNCVFHINKPTLQFSVETTEGVKQREPALVLMADLRQMAVG